MSGGDSDPQGGGVLLWHWPSGIGVEGGDVDLQLLPHRLHFLPQSRPLFPVGLQHSYRLSRVQTAPAVNTHERGGHVSILSGTTQDI